MTDIYFKNIEVECEEADGRKYVLYQKEGK